MTSPLLALRVAIRAALAADPALVALLGGARVYDEVPTGADPPYLVFGEAEARDWSTGDGDGHRHRLALVAWSRQGGDAEALAAVECAAAVLHEADLALEGHRLVSLRAASRAVGRPDRQGLRRATLRLAALTEVL